MINSCQGAVTLLVRRRLRPVKIPVDANIFLAPYLSRAQPPRIANNADSVRYAEKTMEVVALLNEKSACKYLKKTPKEKRMPKVIKPIIKRAATTIHLSEIGFFIVIGL